MSLEASASPDGGRSLQVPPNNALQRPRARPAR